MEIARKYRSTPWKVYHLGHGGRGKTPKDMKILEELWYGNVTEWERVAVRMAKISESMQQPRQGQGAGSRKCLA